MKRLLLISYYFPPDGGAGTQRAAKFCRYLPNHGWEVTVLTRTVPAVRGRWEPEDATLKLEVPGCVGVRRVAPAGCPVAWGLEVPARDPVRPWVEPAFAAAMQLASETPPDVVLITMSPFGLARLGVQIQRLLKLPVVYDLRDPWALDGWRRYRSRGEWNTDLRRMRGTLSSADGVIANTPEARHAMGQLGELDPNRVAVIPNGYDAADFDDVVPATLPEHFPLDAAVLVHTGTLHDSAANPAGVKDRLRSWLSHRPEPIIPSGRSLVHLLRAVSLLRRGGCVGIDRLRIVIVGALQPASLELIQRSGVSDLVHTTGYVSHRKSISWLLAADALFLPLHGLPPGRRSLIVPGKTYEYLASRKPILACLPDGDARDIVAESGRVIFADPCKEDEIANAVRRVLDRDLPQGQAADHRPYERQVLTAHLSEFLARVCATGAHV